GVFTQLLSRRTELVGADELLEDVASVLRQDEIHVSLGARLSQLAEAGQRLLGSVGPGAVSAPQSPPVAPPPQGSRQLVRVALSSDPTQARAELSALLERLDAALAEHGADLQVSGDVELRLVQSKA